MKRPVAGVRWVLGVTAAASASCAEAPASSAPPLSELPQLSLVEELRIGSLEDPELGFSSIGGIRVGPSGEVWVHESTDQQIRLYDAEGRLLRRYGREGDGPGEFRSIFGFGVQGDTLWVSDGRHRRLTLFDRSGALLGTVSGRVDVPLGQIDGAGPPRTLTVFPNDLGPGGRIIGRASLVRYPNLPDSVVEVPTILFGSDGSVLDTIELVSRVVSFPALLVSFPTARGGSVTSSLRIDPPMPDSGTFSSAVEVGDTVSVSWAVVGSPPVGVLTASRRQAEGELYRSQVSYSPRAVPPEYLDSVAAERPNRLQLSRSDSAELAARARAVLRMPPHHRPITQLDPTPEGGVWIRLAEADAAANRWLVVGADGRTRGIVDLSPGARVGWNDEARVWLVERDEFDVSWLVRYRLGDAP